MIIVMKPAATKEQIDHVKERVIELGLRPQVSEGAERTVVGAIGDERKIMDAALEAVPGVEKVMAILKPYKIVSREFKPDDTVVDIGGIKIGGKQMQVIAGPCSVESQEQMRASAQGAKAGGARLMRGGAFKPRTSPYAFQGLGAQGLDYLIEAAREADLPVVTELMDPRDLDLFLEKGVDCFQIGTRNMANFRLLKELGKTDKPVILKRGFSATYKEWLMSAEYIAAEGNHNIILCERGIRTHEPDTRNTLDVTAVVVLKQLTHLPVIIDPSHAGGKSWMVPGLSKASIAVGADGLLIEIHPDPEKALSDGEQALTSDQFAKLMPELDKVAVAVGRSLLE